MPIPPTPASSTPAQKPAKRGVGMNFFKRFMASEPSIQDDNRREEPRTPVVGEIVVAVLDKSGSTVGQTRAFVSDLSAQGCSFWSRVRFAEGTRLVFSFPDASGGPALARPATVCHARAQNGSGFTIGCRFTAERAAA